jgi:hypothetical protein
MRGPVPLTVMPGFVPGIHSRQPRQNRTGGGYGLPE